MDGDFGPFAEWQESALASGDGLRGVGFDEGLDGFVPGFDELLSLRWRTAYDPWDRTWDLAGHAFE